MRLLALTVFLSCAARAAAQTFGSEPGVIFDAGVSARALAMGSAFTAVSGDASALYYNPAGLGLMDGRHVEAMHSALYGGASFDYAGYAQNLPKASGGWGVEVLRLGVGGIDGRDAADNPTGSFGYSELGAGAGFGLTDVVVDSLSLGTGIKIDDRSLLGTSNRLIGADFGAQYGPFFNEKLTAGLLLSNAVSVAQGGTSDRLTPAVRAGAAYQATDPLLLVMDVSNTGNLRAGVEYRWNMFALRAGWTSGGLTLGGGVLIHDSLSFDIAALDSTTLGFSERISVGYRFGAYRTTTHSSLALENLVNGRRALGNREYVEAGRDFDAALAADPGVGRKMRIDGGGWKGKIQRLRRLLDVWALDERTEDLDDLRAPTIAAQLTETAVRALVDGNLDDAMILAQVAAGEGPRGTVFTRLPKAMSAASGKPIVDGATLSVSAFVADRIRRTGDAYYARRFAQAIEFCRQNTLVEPDSAPAWERLGAAYLKAGKTADAAAAYRKSLALDPENATLIEFVRAHFK